MAVRDERLIWARDGVDWPNRDLSRFIETRGLTWHVQQAGHGPLLLLLHGTGASTHSFRDLIPALARDYSILAVDLPGHGFTDLPPFYRLSLDGMARALDELLRTLAAKPAGVVGHSAGAAIGARLALDRAIRADLLISLNGALLPFRGAPNFLFPAIAKALFLNPLTPRIAARRASPKAVARLIRDTGSHLDERGLDLYCRLMRTPAHIAGALGMMANWKLQGLARELPRLETPIVFVACDGDRAVPPADGATLAGRVPHGRYLEIPSLGHLGHEENPPRFIELIRSEMRHAGGRTA
ncbi:MAG: alpha/beta fold hydrolase [Marivibrio sp.]|uniref:alpha/beta fold hydrolase BchO n=1 Tax=Marivibrio sp. TaxID=2039719 RepID=UPI0032EA9BC3